MKETDYLFSQVFQNFVSWGVKGFNYLHQPLITVNITLLDIFDAEAGKPKTYFSPVYG